MKKTFKGGIHPPDSKDLSRYCPIRALENLPGQISVLMSQHIGAICKPVVKKRQEVEKGQLIGNSEAFVSANVHSPVSGTVKDINLRSHPVLGRVQAVVIEPSEQSPEAPPEQSRFANFTEDDYSAEQINQSIAEAGIVGMGGAGFPTGVKVGPNPKMPKETMILNACECEPYITCDYRVMLEWTDQLIAGIKLLRKASGCKKCYIGIENNKPEAVKLLREKTEGEENIELSVLETKYPQGGERQLVNSVLGKVIPTGKIPPMAGVMVCNVATAAAAAEAVCDSAPLTHRTVTVTGKGIQTPANLYVPAGTPVQHLIEQCGGLTEDAVKVVLGGPMTGFSVGELQTPTTKTTGCVLCLTKEEIGEAKYLFKKTPCIRCGRCLSVCPETLNPTKIAHAVKADRLDLAEKHNISACMECGSCSYICPANIEVTGYIKTGKIRIARANKDMPA
ncbi:Nitrogen fixation protein RnfC [Sedimentisphaera cyanobacteriorum]|uniref:Ion-translocating oxidoreductase complex subunit C n=1 Tax=Sedimentisphaera cyanobacteriorum TaxID=1940790 RepID=A0A1Q2HP31_9BACT|nr:electron transport complex subunit RsxC [Sedimentisphaera cyanobacteriorum]AQQ08993.1 Nitrogen fixation protein RnfC [Sedimentisphaera cyanobacteriorum]